MVASTAVEMALLIALAFAGMESELTIVGFVGMGLRMKADGFRVLYACIAAPTGADDPHLSRASIDFHTRLGYAVAGTFHRCGYKFGTWYDVVWMEKRLSDDAVPSAVVPYPAQVL